MGQPESVGGVAAVLVRAEALLAQLECDGDAGAPRAAIAGPDRALLAEGEVLLAQWKALLAKGVTTRAHEAAAVVWAHRLLAWAAAVRATRARRSRV